MDTFKEKTPMVGSAAGRKRQQILAEIFAPSTSDFLGQVDLSNKRNVLDLGCGIGKSTFLLKSMISAEGKVTGLDSKETQLNITREKVLRTKMTAIEFLYQNTMEWEEEQSYDLVYSRHFFNLLSNPLIMLQKVFNSLQPGGLVMIEEEDFSMIQCFPNSYAFDRFVELYTELIQRQGVNLNTGIQLRMLLQQVGFETIQVQLVRPRFLTPRNKCLTSLTLESISTILEKENLASALELLALLSEIKSFEAQKNTMITQPGIYQVIGYRTGQNKCSGP